MYNNGKSACYEWRKQINQGSIKFNPRTKKYMRSPGDALRIYEAGTDNIAKNLK